MKKLINLLIILFIAIGLVACSGSKDAEEPVAIEEQEEPSDTVTDEDASLYPYTLTEEEKEEFKAGLRNYWLIDIETVNFNNPTVQKYYSKDPYQKLLSFTGHSNEWAPGNDLKEAGMVYDTPDFMDGIRDTYYGMFFSVDKIVKTDENTYVAEGINYDPWEFFCENTGFDKIEYFAIRIDDPQTSDKLTLFLADDPDCGVVFIRNTDWEVRD